MADTLSTNPGHLRFHLVSFRTTPAPPYHPYRRPASELPFSCTLCGTAYTPLRRAGPRGRNTLCNACGLQWARKERLRREDGPAPRSVSAPVSPQTSPRPSVDVSAERRLSDTPAPQSKMAIAALLN